MVHELAEMRVGFEDGRRLGSVNQSSSKLAGMVHTKLSIDYQKRHLPGIRGEATDEKASLRRCLGNPAVPLKAVSFAWLQMGY